MHGIPTLLLWPPLRLSSVIITFWYIVISSVLPISSTFAHPENTSVLWVQVPYWVWLGVRGYPHYVHWSQHLDDLLNNVAEVGQWHRPVECVKDHHRVCKWWVLSLAMAPSSIPSKCFTRSRKELPRAITKTIFPSLRYGGTISFSLKWLEDTIQGRSGRKKLSEVCGKVKSNIAWIFGRVVFTCLLVDSGRRNIRGSFPDKDLIYTILISNHVLRNDARWVPMPACEWESSSMHLFKTCQSMWIARCRMDVRHRHNDSFRLFDELFSSPEEDDLVSLGGRGQSYHAVNMSSAAWKRQNWLQFWRCLWK